MADMIRKSFVGKVKTELKDGERAVIATITTDAMDRDKEVILPKGIDTRNWHKDGRIVLWGHDYYSPENVIGKGVWLQRTDHGLTSKWVPAPTEDAEKVYTLLQKGFLRTFSIGFIPKESRPPKEEEIKKRPDWAGVRRIHTKIELLEFSVVAIPSNTDALVIEVGKGLAIPKVVEEALEANVPTSIDVLTSTLNAYDEKDSELVIPSKEEVRAVIKVVEDYFLPAKEQQSEQIKKLEAEIKRLEADLITRKKVDDKNFTAWIEAQAEIKRLQGIIKRHEERHKKAIERMKKDTERAQSIAQRRDAELETLKESKEEVESAAGDLIVSFTGRVL